MQPATHTTEQERDHSTVRRAFVYRVSGVLFAPSSTLGEIADKPEWIKAVLASMVLTLLTTGLLQWRVPPDVEGFVRRSAEQQRIQLTEEQFEQNVRMNQLLQRFLPLVDATVNAVSMLLVGAALWAFFSVTYSPVRFKQMMAVTSYSWLSTKVVYSILFIIILLLRDPREIGPENREFIVASNFAPMLPKGTAYQLVVVAKAVDLFTVGYLCLLSVGVACVTRMPIRKAALTITALWAGWLVIRVALAYLGIGT